MINTSTQEYRFRLTVAINDMVRENILYVAPQSAEMKKLNQRRRPKEIQRVVGERLMVLRTRLGITQAEVAALSGLSVQTVSHMENGKSGNMTSLVCYADALNIPLNVILEGTARDEATTYRAPFSLRH